MLKVGLIVSIVLALASMGAAGWFYMQAQSGTGVRAAVSGAPNSTREFTGAAPNRPNPEMEKDAMYISVHPPIVANFDDNGEVGYYQATVELLTYDKEAKPVIEMHMPRVRDALLKLFNAQTSQTLRGSNAMDELRVLAKVEVDKIMVSLGAAPVAGLYFSAFVVQ